MYAALDKNGTLTYAQQAVENQKYYCCHCDKQVKLILTESRRYFRHTNQADNQINERLIHLKGKKLLVDHLKKFGFQNVNLEVYLDQIQQRPDILVDQKIAFEYQCAKIDLQTLVERVNGYRKLAMKNIWVLGGGYLGMRLRKEHLKFINFNYSWGHFIMMLDSLNQQLTLFHHIKFLGPFNKIFYQRETFVDEEIYQVFHCRPSEYQLQKQVMDDYFLQKLRQKNDPKSQKIKLDFYRLHKQTVEDYLRGYEFSPQVPIYSNPAWQVVCGRENELLIQPLLNFEQIKKPPQK